jgi:hypothetical protein
MPGPRRLPPLLLALLALAVLLFSLLPVQTAAQVGCAAKKCYPNNGQGCTFAPTVSIELGVGLFMREAIFEREEYRELRGSRPKKDQFNAVCPLGFY